MMTLLRDTLLFMEIHVLEPQRQKNVPSDMCALQRFGFADSGSLIRIFTERIWDSRGCKLSSCVQQSL